MIISRMSVSDVKVVSDKIKLLGESLALVYIISCLKRLKKAFFFLSIQNIWLFSRMYKICTDKNELEIGVREN